MAETPSPNRTLKISVPESAAAKLDFEAQLENRTVDELVRGSIATHVLYKSVMREIKAYFGDTGEDMAFYITVTAVQGIRAQDFSVAPNPDTMQINVVPGEEYEI
jgi:hypothetical protein